MWFDREAVSGSASRTCGWRTHRPADTASRGMRGLLSHSQGAGVGIFLENDLAADIGLIAGVPFGMVIITAVLGLSANGAG